MPSEAAMPQARLLNYVSRAVTPTRVRMVATTGLYVLALICLLAFAVGLICLIPHIGHDLYYTTGMGGGEVLVWAFFELKSCFFYDPLSSLAVVQGLPLAGGFALCAPFVARGSKTACQVSHRLLDLLIVEIFVASTAFVANAMVLAFAIAGGDHQTRQLFWLLILPIVVLGILLLLDLASFTIWIGRNPVVEMPPKPFLPTSNDAQPLSTAGRGPG